MPRTRFALTLLVTGAAALTLTGLSCGKKTAERAAENAVERASNGNVNVDINKNSVTVNINGGSTVGTVGESVSVPADFPADVYIIDGTVKTAVKNAETKGFSLSINTSLTPTETQTRYEDQLKAQGWNIILSVKSGDGATLSAEKNGRNVSVIISTIEGVTNVILGTTEKPSG